MDFEKAYKEALERAKAGKPMDEVFPELKESEDERIRKDIIGGLMWQRDNLKSEGPHDNNLILPGFCFTVGEHLAYLEKQKEENDKRLERVEQLRKRSQELDAKIKSLRRKIYGDEQKDSRQKMVLENPLTGEKVYEREIPECMMGGDPKDVEAIVHLTVKGWTVIAPGREQNLTPKFKVGDRIYDKRDSYNRNVIREVGKDYYINAFAQKMDMAYTDANFEFLEHLDNDLIPNKTAEWSDSVAKEMFIKALERAVEQTKSGYKLTDCDKHSWWEDFKAYSGINPAEWSEEDKRAIDRACVALRAYSNGDLPEFLPSELLGYADRLQSLRPHPHWKPSEEQMKALWEVEDRMRNNKSFTLSNRLASLYNDLKKLM